jgi:hypothetical protein
MENIFEILAGKFELNRQLVSPRRGWDDNIKMGLKEVGCGDVN